MFQGLAQGSALYVLYKNEPRLECARVISSNTHIPQFNPAQPQAMLNGMVTDITATVGTETVSFAAVPANASVASFPDKGLFVSENQTLAINELIALRDNYKRLVDSYESNKMMMDKCDALLVSNNPELQNAKEMQSVKDELAEIKALLSALRGQSKTE